MNGLNPENLRNDYRDLICSVCKKYLSVSPIFTSDDGKSNKCGRCTGRQYSEKTLMRNKTYEKLAKFMQFPCSESRNCKEILAWGKVINHELVCPFRPILCPHSNCLETYEINTVLSHFCKKHKVYSESVISHDLCGKFGETDVILIDTKNCRFLACFLFEDEFLWINVFTLSTRETGYKFAVAFNSQTCKVEYNPRFIGTYSEDSCSTATIHSKFAIKQEFLKHLLDIDETNSMTIKLEILDRKEAKHSQLVDIKNISFENMVLKAIECPICFEIMRANIYLCYTGHSLCAKCKTKTSRCPTCISPYHNSRNYALEALYQQFKAVANPPLRSQQKPSSSLMDDYPDIYD